MFLRNYVEVSSDREGSLSKVSNRLLTSDLTVKYVLSKLGRVALLQQADFLGGYLDIFNTLGQRLPFVNCKSILLTFSVVPVNEHLI